MRIPPIYWLVGALVLLLLPGLGWSPLFDWDEVNFAEISREMFLTGDWLRPQIDFAPFWEKPPLFFWLQTLGFSTLGVGEYAARLPNAICGLVTALTLYFCGKELQGPRFGLFWAGLHCFSLLPLVYFRSGIIDPWFNYFIFLALWAWFTAPGRTQPTWGIIVAGICAGLAVLTKGPVALLVIGLVVLIRQLARREAWGLWLRRGLFFALVAGFVVALWLVPLWRIDGGWFATEFVRYQWRLLTTADAGHGGFPGYHIVVLLLGCFPAAALALPWLWKRLPQPRAADGWLRTLFWVVLILFSLVQTKIVHYSSLCYFPLSYFAASAIGRTDSRAPIRAWRWKWATGLPVLMGLLLLPLIGRYAAYFRELAIDYSEVTARLALPVDWPWWTLLPGLIFAVGWSYSGWLVAQGRSGQRAVGMLLGATAIGVSLGLLFLAPRIEVYTQREVRLFFTEHAEEQAYLMPLGFKSYLHLFYGRRTPKTGLMKEDRPVWYKTAPAELPVWIAAPSHRREELETALPAAELRYVRGGFTFYYLAPGDSTQE